MAVNHSRSMNKDFNLGAIDGSIRKRDGGQRGGVVEKTSDAAHDQATEMGMGPATTYANAYGEGEVGVTLGGVRRR